MRFSLKENRKKFASATNLDRKCGVAQWRDLRFSCSLSTVLTKEVSPSFVISTEA